jgi:hypothetical protein
MTIRWLRSRHKCPLNKFPAAGKLPRAKRGELRPAGPLVRDISGVFDHCWQGNGSVPISALVTREYTRQDLRESESRLRRLIDQGSYPYPTRDDQRDPGKTVEDFEGEVVWAKGRVIWEDPNTISDPGQTSEIISIL